MKTYEKDTRTAPDPEKEEPNIPGVERAQMTEEVHTIMFWADPSKSEEIYIKAHEALQEYAEYIKFSAVAPYLVKAQNSGETTK